MARTHTQPPPFPTRTQSSSSSTTSSFQTPFPSTSFSQLSFPAPHILLVTLSRPAFLNCINAAGHHELAAVWAWLDNEPSLRVGIVTGAGKAFCAGADLKGKDAFCGGEDFFENEGEFKREDCNIG